VGIGRVWGFKYNPYCSPDISPRLPLLQGRNQGGGREAVPPIVDWVDFLTEKTGFVGT